MVSTKKNLDFHTIEFPHNGQVIFVSIMSVTFDNATNNTTAIELFIRQLKTPVGNDLFHVKCICQIINLNVKDRLKKFKIKFKKLNMSFYILDFLHIDTKNLIFFYKTHDEKSKKILLATDHR